MKTIFITMFSLCISIGASASVSCLRFMGKVESVAWTKNCSVILEDHGRVAVREIDGCFAKFTQRGVDYLVFNSDLIKETGYVQKDGLITKASYKRDVTETSEQIKAIVESASPELLQRYRHEIDFDKNSQQLSISMSKGLFTLNPVYRLVLQCSDR